MWFSGRALVTPGSTRLAFSLHLARPKLFHLFLIKVPPSQYYHEFLVSNKIHFVIQAILNSFKFIDLRVGAWAHKKGISLTCMAMDKAQQLK